MAVGHPNVVGFQPVVHPPDIRRAVRQKRFLALPKPLDIRYGDFIHVPLEGIVGWHLRLFPCIRRESGGRIGMFVQTFIVKAF